MNHRLFPKILLIATLLVLGLILIQLASAYAVHNEQKEGNTPEKINLALRRTAHLMLKAAGDSTSSIAAVTQPKSNVWSIRLEKAFNYDQLPTYLQASFDVHGIQSNYDVSVLRCDNQVLQLGYTYLDFLEKKDVPCGGRDLEDGCYQLNVTFPDMAPSRTPYSNTIWLLPIGALCLFLLFFILKTRQRPTQQPIPTEPSDTHHEHTPFWISFGNSRLDPNTQVLVTATSVQQLTYRETKLLQLFVTHCNQLLERDFILQNVWADEGIIVGRSLDVFVSRLRKLLQDDPMVRIKTVHGVGYRLETGAIPTA